MEIVKALDVDDILAGFYLAMCMRYNVPIRQRDIWDGKRDCKFIADNFHEIENDANFWGHLPVLNAPEKLTFDFDYYISSFPKQMRDARMSWLMNKGFPGKPLICSSNKLKSCRELGVNVLVDDRYETIDSLEHTEVMGVWYRPWYMIDQGQDLDDLTKLDEHIKSRLQKEATR